MKIAIDITNKCDLNCEYCYAMKQYGKKWNTEDMSLKRIQLIIKQFYKIKTFNPETTEINILGGEPFLHPNIINILKYLNTFNFIKKGILTNFLQKNEFYENILMNELNSDYTLHISFHWIKVNKKKFFEKIEKCKYKHLIIHLIIPKNNLSEVNEYKKEIKSLAKHYRIYLDYVIDDDSWHSGKKAFKNIYIDNILDDEIKKIITDAVQLNGITMDFVKNNIDTFTKQISCKGNLINIDIYGNSNILCPGLNVNIFTNFLEFKKGVSHINNFFKCPNEFCACVDALETQKKILKG